MSPADTGAGTGVPAKDPGSIGRERVTTPPPGAGSADADGSSATSEIDIKLLSPRPKRGLAFIVIGHPFPKQE
ncbi:MAG: hypothetical protein JWL69_3382 [Phycisphaerales bacterium]|nr:hypothetical protein [Phycisphaerales bacterium]